MGNSGQKKWRDDGYNTWDEKVVMELRDDIYKCIDGLYMVQHIEIIFCGGVGEGKSSVINNCMAALTGSYSILAACGAGSRQITKQYKGVQLWNNTDGNVKSLPLTFCDTRGFSASMEFGAPVEAIKACILGKVLHDETIDPNVCIEAWRNKKAVKCKSSYIFLVADATMVPDDGNIFSVTSMMSVYQNLREIQDFAFKEGFSTAAFLTMCDRLEPMVKSDIRCLHYSTLVEKKVKAFHKMIGIPESRIFPIMNYTGEIQVTPEMATQTLIALRVCLQDILAIVMAGPK